MSGVTSLSPAMAMGGAESGTGLIMLKKSQDLMSQQAAQLLAALPPSTPSTPGMGGMVDIQA